MIIIRDRTYSEAEYNDIPVVYCRHCLSLAIRNIDDTDYCDQCGGTIIDHDKISNWEKLYEHRYGRKFVTKK